MRGDNVAEQTDTSTESFDDPGPILAVAAAYRGFLWWLAMQYVLPVVAVELLMLTGRALGAAGEPGPAGLDWLRLSWFLLVPLVITLAAGFTAARAHRLASRIGSQAPWGWTFGACAPCLCIWLIFAVPRAFWVLACVANCLNVALLLLLTARANVWLAERGVDVWRFGPTREALKRLREQGHSRPAKPA